MSQIDLNDPRLTLYALREMEPREQAEFEQLLATDAAARQAVEEIRAAGVLLTEALEHEPAPVAEKPAAQLLRFPQMYFMISGLAAACFAVVFVLWQNGYKEPQATRLIEVPLTPVAEAKKAEKDQPVLEFVTGGKETARTTVVAANQAAGAAPAADQVVKLDTFEVSGKAVAAQALAAAPVKTREPMVASLTVDQARADVEKRDAKDEQPGAALALGTGAASYADVRRFLLQGQRPPAAAVHIAELVNHFTYHYAPPVGGLPLAVTLESAGAPWDPAHRLVRIGLQGGDAGAGSHAIVARDVRLQVEFNPAVVATYRLIDADKPTAAATAATEEQDAGVEFQAGHAVTALYEVTLVGPGLPAGQMLTVKVRYKEPAGDAGRALEFPLRDNGAAFTAATPDFKFTAAVAAFGLILRDSPLKGAATLADVAAWSRAATGDEAGADRTEFVSLVEKAMTIQ